MALARRPQPASFYKRAMLSKKAPPAMKIQKWLPCSLLGSCSSARVSLAISLPDGLPFALKSPLSPSSSPSLRNELLTLLPLSSPFILRCFGADLASSDHGSPRHLFLEFMDGGSLFSLLKRSGGSLDESLIRRYALSIVRGLEYLHLNGIVHCDIKAHNILIGSSGVKIADFGAVKRSGSANEEVAGQSKFSGTPLWMAPEVVQGVEQESPSDIWSLGCTVVELFQGRPPWADMGAGLYKLGCTEEDPPLPEAISDDARDFLLHCLQRDPKARWSASELLQHPFLCNIASEDIVKHEQLSPRSTLDFLQNRECDSEDACDFSTLSTSSFELMVKSQLPTDPTAPSLKRRFTEAFDLNEQEWITVKRAGIKGCREMKEMMPFMKSGNVHVRKARDVSLEAARFLQNRKVVG
ncbi:hypothetical protein L7F22_061893 [Adiantum nelumboides]|nr:hypothetical protein [Adiantum nelumboides]